MTSSRESLAVAHLDHAITQIRVVLDGTRRKLRLLQHPGVKFSPQVQWCITILNVIGTAVEQVKRDRDRRLWERL